MSVSGIGDEGDCRKIVTSRPGPVSGAARRAEVSKGTPGANELGLLLIR